MHCYGLDVSVGAKQALEHGGQRPPEQREADDEDGVRKTDGRRAAAASLLRRLLPLSFVVVCVIFPVNCHVQMGLTGRVAREADWQEEKARGEGERRCRSSHVASSVERARKSAAEKKQHFKARCLFRAALPSVLPSSHFSSFFFLSYSPSRSNPAMAEPPGSQVLIISSGGERAEEQQQQQRQQQEQQQREKQELASETRMPSSASGATPTIAGALPDAQQPPPPRDATVATSDEELAPPVRLTASTSREENSPAPQRMRSTLVFGNPSSMTKAATPPSTPGSGAAKPSFEGGLNVSSEDFEEAPLLPRGTRIVVRGNQRTRAALIGKAGTVRTAVGLGGWHLLVCWFLLFVSRSRAQKSDRERRGVKVGATRNLRVNRSHLIWLGISKRGVWFLDGQLRRVSRPQFRSVWTPHRCERYEGEFAHHLRLKDCRHRLRNG